MRLLHLNRKKEALDALRKAWEAGFQDAAWARRDPDIASLHGEPEFERLYPEKGPRIPVLRLPLANQISVYKRAQHLRWKRPSPARDDTNLSAPRLLSLSANQGRERNNVADSGKLGVGHPQCRSTSIRPVARKIVCVFNTLVCQR